MGWREESGCSLTYVPVPGYDNHIYKLTVHQPDEYSEVWTAQAERLDQNYRQVRFSGLLNGGDTRDTAKAAALVALANLKKKA